MLSVTAAAFPLVVWVATKALFVASHLLEEIDADYLDVLATQEFNSKPEDIKNCE